MIEYLTPLTLEDHHQDSLSDHESNEDVTEVWTVTKSESTNKARRLKEGMLKGTETPNLDEVF